MPPRQPSCYQIVAPRKRNPSNSFRLQEPIRQGEVLSDVSDKKWKLGRSIGVGAFGEIYLASDDLTKQVGPDTKYVVKVEPHTNGPLFVEMNFYLRVGKEEKVAEWKTSKRLKQLGMPVLYGFGSHMYKGERYRFLVLPRFGDDLHKVHLKHSKRFHIKTALTLACHIMDTLEYIHSNGYVHSDIKGMNMVLGETYPAPVYLLDFGLASKFAYRNGVHKEYRMDGRKADAGTLEFSSRDAHIGALSRRSDLESLGYNLVRWLQGKLPWENELSNAETVAELKEKAMTNVKGFISAAFPSTHNRPPDVLLDYLSYVASLEFEAKPDYKYCKQLFSKGVRSAGFLDDFKLTFDAHAKLPKKSLKRAAECENLVKPKRKKIGLLTDRKPCSVFNQVETTRVTRNLDKGRLSSKEFDWAMVLAGHPEKNCEIKKVKKERTKSMEQSLPKIETSIKVEAVDPPGSELLNPTPAMRKVMQRKKQRNSDSYRRSRHDSTNGPSNLTPAMEEVIARRSLWCRTLRSATRKGVKDFRLSPRNSIYLYNK